MDKSINVMGHVNMPYVSLAWHSQVWLQEFAWTEEDEDTMLAARSLALPTQYNQQPLFCFETMMHMLYWSCLAYEHKRVSLQRVHAANVVSRINYNSQQEAMYITNAAGC